MADYFTNFSFVLPLKNAGEIEYALNLHRQALGMRDAELVPKSFPESLGNCLENWCFDIKADAAGVWLHSQSGGIDSVCAFVQHLLEKCNPAGVVTFEWSHDCTQPRIDAFGGGAAIITATEIKTMNTSDWIRANTTIP